MTPLRGWEVISGWMQDSKCWSSLLDAHRAARREGYLSVPGGSSSETKRLGQRPLRSLFQVCGPGHLSFLMSPELSDNEICRFCLSNLLGSVSFPICSQTLSWEAVLDSTRPSLNITLNTAAAGAAPSWPVCPWRPESFFPDAWILLSINNSDFSLCYKATTFLWQTKLETMWKKKSLTKVTIPSFH